MIVHPDKLIYQVAELSLIASVNLIPAGATHRRLFVFKLLLQYIFEVMYQFLVCRVFLEMFFVILN